MESQQPENKRKRRVSDEQIESEVIAHLRQMKADYENAEVFITEKISFKVRDLIRTCRKNYWGVYDSPINKNTGQKKTWVPLTESLVETAVKNIDLDTKDINFRAKKGSAIGVVPLVRNAVKNYLDATFFGEYLDEMERNLAIDGTAVWKTLEVKDDENKPVPRIYPIDLLNFFIDPSARCIQEADVLERVVMTHAEFLALEGLKDQDLATPQENISRNEMNVLTTTNSQKMVEAWEFWGDIPLHWITGKKRDKEKRVPGHAIVSGLSHNKIFVHLLEKNPNKKGLKPYEEAWFSRVNGRWYGRGPAERAIALQLWINTIVNIRITRSLVSQLGIFKIRKGSGITAQSLSRLPVNGAITVNNMEDLEQLAMQEASQSSYTDEQVIFNWAQRVTSSFETATGEGLPSSTPATNAALQSRAAMSSFTFVKKGIGMFLQRWLKRHALPIIQKRLTPAEVIRLTGEFDELNELDELLVNQMLYAELAKRNKEGRFFTEENVMREKDRLMTALRAKGRDRFFKLAKTMNLSDYDVQVYVTNEEFDKAVMATNLTQALQVVSKIPGLNMDTGDIVRQLFDLMGLEAPRRSNPQPQLPPGVAPAQAMPQQPQQQQVPNEQNVVTRANTMAQ